MQITHRSQPDESADTTLALQAQVVLIETFKLARIGSTLTGLAKASAFLVRIVATRRLFEM